MALSDLGDLLPSVAFLADLHPVQTIMAWYLITAPPPPSLLHAGILASRYRVKQFESSPVPHGRVLATRSCLLYAGCMVRYPSLMCKQQGTNTIPFGPSVSAISLVQVYDASDAGFFRQHRPQG